MAARIFWGLVLIGLLVVFVIGPDTQAGNVIASDDMTITDELDVGGAAEVGGSLAVTGDVTAGDDVIATDDVEAGDDLVVSDDATIGDDLTVTGEFKGARCIISFGRVSTSADVWLRGGGGPDCTASHGSVMAHAGSIISISAAGQWDKGIGADTGAYYNVLINNTSALKDTLLVDGDGYYDGYKVQARGVDTFTAGQWLTVYWDLDGSGTWFDIFVNVEVQYDD